MSNKQSKSRLTKVQLIAQIKAKDIEIKKFRDALIWCSVSGDFGLGGQARRGWLKLCKPLIESK